MIRSSLVAQGTACPGPRVLRVDLHNHTDCSPDGLLGPLRLLRLAQARGLDCIAVTDHDRIVGARRCLELAEADPSLPRVIPGVEVRSKHGEIVGLFLERDIPAGRSGLYTIDLIHAYGGIVYLPHPFDHLRRATLAADRVEELARHADVIEVANGRALLPQANGRALALATRSGARLGAGSDAHFAGEVGRCYLEIPLAPTAAASRRLPQLTGGRLLDAELLCRRDLFLLLLAGARPCARDWRWAVLTAWWYALGTGGLKAARRLTGCLQKGRLGTTHV